MPASSLDAICREVVSCRRCPRLVEWRETVAAERRAAYSSEVYWGRPVPGFGDPAARLVVVGLAPAAHGGNRTGRIFTGDRSGDWLWAALWRAGLATQPESVTVSDGLQAVGTWVTAVVRCAPPGNRPTPQERDNCLPYLEQELALLPVRRAARPGRVRVRRMLPHAGCDQEACFWPRRRSANGQRYFHSVLVPPEPAEHIYRPAHRGDARRRCPARLGARRRARRRDRWCWCCGSPLTVSCAVRAC